MNQEQTIDVTKLEPRMKHPTIFKAFDALEGGDAILLHNDHDPRPLYYQLLGERGNIFSWNYKVSGPEVWEVEIRKHSADHVSETVGGIVAKDLQKAMVFKKYGIDFCCGGKKSLEDACREQGLDVLKVRQELEQPSREAAGYTPELKYDEWSAGFLADFIEQVHHSYVRKGIPVLKDLAESVCTHHASTHPELIQIREKVLEIANELVVHMKKEEQVLFPYIRKMEASLASGVAMTGGFPSVKSPVSVMEQDHEVVGALFADIDKLSGNYLAPADSCQSYKLFYKKLQEFYQDLILHIHLENNILFPRAVGLEQQMKAL
jgi:regulator of cell morphogenesis and NO signaling